MHRDVGETVAMARRQAFRRSFKKPEMATEIQPDALAA